MVSKEERSDGTDNIDVFDKIKTNKIAGAHTETTGGTTGRPFSFETVVNGTMGSFFNCGKSYLDLDSTGKCTGLMSAHNMELRTPTTQFGSQGTYTCAEHELVFQASTTIGAPVSFAYFNISGDGTALANWEDTGFFWILGAGFNEGTGNVFSAGAGALTTAGTLKIKIGAATYYIMLSSDEAN